MRAEANKTERKGEHNGYSNRNRYRKQYQGAGF